jgi:predicted metal-binding protein
MSKSHHGIRELPAKWDDVILVCRKCSKKLHGGFGENQDVRLEKLLRRASKNKGKGKKRAVKVLQVSCLDVCPKNAVTVVQGSRPGAFRIVKRGTPEEEILEAFGCLPPQE